MKLLAHCTYPLYISYLISDDHNKVFVHVSEYYDAVSTPIEVVPERGQQHYGPMFKILPPSHLDTTLVAVMDNIIQVMSNLPEFVHNLHPHIPIERFVFLRPRKEGGGRLGFMDVEMINDDVKAPAMVSVDVVREALALMRGPRLHEACALLESNLA